MPINSDRTMEKELETLFALRLMITRNTCFLIFVCFMSFYLQSAYHRRENYFSNLTLHLFTISPSTKFPVLGTYIRYWRKWGEQPSIVQMNRYGHGTMKGTSRKAIMLLDLGTRILSLAPLARKLPLLP